MKWVIQSNLYNEDAFEELITQLNRQTVDYDIVKVIPFIAELEPDINPNGKVFVIGATSMKKIANKKGWNPGYIDDNLDYRNLIQNYDKFMLNQDAIVAPMNQVEKKWNVFHLRPVLDSKSFSGMVTDWEALEEWRIQIENVNDGSSLTTLKVDDLVVMSPLREIYAEYRFHIIGGKVISGSLYKRGSRVFSSSDVAPDIIDFAQKMANIWCPNEAFALDIAETPEGLKVIEINSINSAGLYALDMGKFIAAINDYFA